MYAQNPRGASLPRNYSGNAFRYPPIRTETPPTEPMPVEETVPKHPVNDSTGENPEALAVSRPEGVGESGERWGLHRALPSLAGRGLGSEELLLLGLLLLLGGGEGQSDVMICLLILLFCA